MLDPMPSDGANVCTGPTVNEQRFVGRNLAHLEKEALKLLFLVSGARALALQQKLLDVPAHGKMRRI